MNEKGNPLLTEKDRTLHLPSVLVCVFVCVCVSGGERFMKSSLFTTLNTDLMLLSLTHMHRLADIREDTESDPLLTLGWKNCQKYASSAFFIRLTHTDKNYRVENDFSLEWNRKE